MSRAHAVVVGGGITGLATARTLAHLEPAADVTLIEGDDRLGGKLATATIDGVEVELGADSFVARHPDMTSLCHDLGLGDRLVQPSAFGGCVRRGSELRPLPSGLVFGVPTGPRTVLASSDLSVAGRLRALADLVLPGPLEGPDVSVGAFVATRFGRELLEAWVDPVLAGIRAGLPEELGLAAALPEIDGAARQSRSVMRGLAAAIERGRVSPAPPPFFGMRGGMQLVADAVRRELDGRVRFLLGSDAVAVSADDGRHLVELSSREGTSADVVVLAVPTFQAARLLASVHPDAANDLGAIRYASVAIVVLSYPPDAAPRLPSRCSGFLVPSAETRLVTGCTFYSKKWPHARPPDGGHILRCFIGRSGGDSSGAPSNDDIVDAVHQELQEALALRSPPRAFLVRRWVHALPQYGVGHLERVARVEAALQASPGVVLAGAGYTGSGVTDCVRQGVAAAHRAARLLSKIG